MHRPNADDQLIIKTVAETLFMVADWGPSDLGVDIRKVARLVAECNVQEWTCCPMCEEITCDDDCPLHDVRLHAGMWCTW